MICWTSLSLLFFCALLLGAHCLEFSDLESMGLTCSEQNACTGYQNDKALLHRGCECDPDCPTYGDCCIDADVQPPSPGGTATGYAECLQTEQNWNLGVYVVSRCDDEWIGPERIKEKCEEPTDFSDPTSAAPVTSLLQRITYKNLHCAECNHAGSETVESFRYEYSCRGLNQVSREEITKRVTYNQEKKKWGIDVWWDDDEHPTFEECAVVFVVPADFNNSVRFCRANIVSECSSDWIDPHVGQMCQEYTSVVYDGRRGYRNPHCAICNYVATSRLSCSPNGKATSKKRIFTFSTLMDMNRRFSFEKPLFKGRLPCPEGQIFDPYHKKCKKLICALPGYVVRDRICVKGY